MIELLLIIIAIKYRSMSEEEENPLRHYGGIDYEPKRHLRVVK